MLTRDVDSLKAHELNRKIYGDTADEALVDSISRQGILTPLLVTEAGVVISGHRRLEAARKLGLRAVPVQVMPLVGALPIEEALIAANEQRPRTVEQRVREFIHLREIERCRAKLRQRAAGERGHEGGRGRRKEQTLREVSPAGFAAGRSRDLAARRLQLSYKSLEHGVAVVARIDRLAKAGHGREAERLRELLNTKSIRAAFVAARNESGTGAGPRSDRHGAADAGAADEAAAARASAARAVERLVVELRRARSALPEGGLAEAADAAVASIQEAARRHASAGRPEAPARVYQWSLAGALLRAASDQVRALASHELVAALGCSHGCRYCLPAREHTPSALQALGLEADDDCYAVVDPDAPDRVGQQAARLLSSPDIVLVAGAGDAWAPEAQAVKLGARCVRALLQHSPARVRILTKSAGVADDLAAFKGHEHRVAVGISIGTPPSRLDVARAVEPHASPPAERLAALARARRLGFPTFAVLQPCLPGVTDTEPAMAELLDAVLAAGVQEIWLGPLHVGPRGLPDVVQALHLAGLEQEANAVDAALRQPPAWRAYLAQLTQSCNAAARRLGAADKIRPLEPVRA